jgi:chromosome segregation protein
VHLKSLTLKGFKSFPDRARLDFGPGVSVVVGPNGSGKSNITDAVLWAMGEQSPLAVRGQSMQDVIFGGGHGVQARNAAEVEIVLDNSDGTVELPLSEISIVRSLDRTGAGGYRLNGGRCRLSDVIEVLSDTGLGKETHSVISQGRVEEIVSSRPRERRMLIEEAAGLGKHRKRRRRAQLKLERTQENLDRALDVEREARTRLRPLKRQAEAAELHERLERQMLEARMQLARDVARARALELKEAEAEVSEARAKRTEVETTLQDTIARRGLAERALAERAERHEAGARRVYDARAASERVQLRAEQVDASERALGGRIGRVEQELMALGERGPDSPEGQGEHAHERQSAAGQERVAELEAQLREIESERERELGRELEGLQAASVRDAGRVQELERELGEARQARRRADELLEKARQGSVWSVTWAEVRRVIEEGVKRVLAQPGERERQIAVGEVAAHAERVARGVVEFALKGVRAAEETREQAETALREAERQWAEAGEELRRTQWLIEQRRAAPQQGPLAVRRAQLEGELGVERRQAELQARERTERERRGERLRAQLAGDRELLPRAARLLGALKATGEVLSERVAQLEGELAADRAAGEQLAAQLRACAGEEEKIQTQLRGAGEAVTAAEVAAQRLRDLAAEAELELNGIAERLGWSPTEKGTGQRAGGPAARLEAAPADVGVEEASEALEEEQVQALLARAERLERRRQQLGPVNPLAQEEYAEAVAHVEEMEGRREDLESALRELRGVIRDTDRQIQETFQATFQAAARNFEELVGDVFPGGSGRLRLVSEERPLRPVLGGQPLPPGRSLPSPAHGLAGTRAFDGDRDEELAAEAAADAEADELAGDGAGAAEQDLEGVEIEITPAGKAMKRLSLLSGGEKSMTALAFLFAVFLARPCPFYILDEVEAALDDLNLDRFLALLRRFSDRAQFIVITHQKRTMEAADWLYGVSMGGDGVSKVLSRRLPAEPERAPEVAEVA